MLSLSWNNHSITFAHTLASVREKERYSDVTLSCEGNFYPVHKLVLASCSDYFQRLFEQTPCKHPVIVLQDVRSQEMEALLNYMYAGVISVAQSDLPKLIKVAESLQLKGLAVPDENLCNTGNMKYAGHTWSPTNDGSSPYPKTHRKEDSGTQTSSSSMTKIIQPRTSANSQTTTRYSGQGYNSVGSSSNSSSVPHRFSPYHRDSPKIIHRDNNHSRKEHIIIPRVTPKMECKNEGKLYGHYHARPDTTSDRHTSDRHDHRIGRMHGYATDRHSGHTSDEPERGMETEDENSSEMQEMLPVSLVKVEVKEEDEETALDLGDGRECSPPLAPPQDHPLPLVHRASPQELRQRQGTPGMEGASSSEIGMRDDCCDEYDSDSEGELSSLMGGRKSKNSNSDDDERIDERITLQALLGGMQGTSAVTVHFPSHISNSQENQEIDQGGYVDDDYTYLDTKQLPPHTCGLQDPHKHHGESRRNIQPVECSETEAAAVARATMDQKTLQCPLCPYISTRHYVLVRHMRTHTGERPYACPHCNYRGTDKGNLNVHIRSHTGIKPFLCPHCPARFSQNVHLKDHVRIHSGEKPYCCPQCSYRTSKSSDLNRHIKLYCVKRLKVEQETQSPSETH